MIFYKPFNINKIRILTKFKACFESYILNMIIVSIMSSNLQKINKYKKNYINMNLKDTLYPDGFYTTTQNKTFLEYLRKHHYELLSSTKRKVNLIELLDIQIHHSKPFTICRMPENYGKHEGFQWDAVRSNLIQYWLINSIDSISKVERLFKEKENGFDFENTQILESNIREKISIENRRKICKNNPLVDIIPRENITQYVMLGITNADISLLHSETSSNYEKSSRIQMPLIYAQQSLVLMNSISQEKGYDEISDLIHAKYEVN